jgi:hypothetical protein
MIVRCLTEQATRQAVPAITTASMAIIIRPAASVNRIEDMRFSVSSTGQELRKNRGSTRA